MNKMMVPQSNMPQVGTRQGDWVWDGARWMCSPCGDFDDQPFPPFGPPVFSGPTAQPPWYPGANGGVSFGQVPPPNPVRGHFWWNGTTLQMFDGAAWVSIVGGAGGAGVTDGSDAGPGIVGEVMSAASVTQLNAAASETNFTVINTLNLTPGDWEVNASLFINTSMVGGTASWVFLGPSSIPLANTDGSTPAQNVAWWGNDWGTLPNVQGGTVGPSRINTPIAAGADLRAVVVGTSGTSTVDWMMTARRMR